MDARRARHLAQVEHTRRGGTAGTETVVAEAALLQAQRGVGRAARGLRRLTLRACHVADRVAGLRDRAEDVSGRLSGGPAGAEDPALLRARHDRDAAQIDASLTAGETRHRRARRGTRVLAGTVPWLDALLFAYFIAGVSNASLTRPWETPVASLVALAFTAFLVLTVAGYTPWLGHRLRDHKGPHGEPEWGELGGGLLAQLGLWTVLSLAVGLTMFVRVAAEAALSGAEPWIGTAVAVLLALASVGLSVFVLVVSFADGSTLADDVRRRARLLAARERHGARLRARAARLDRRRQRLVRQARLQETGALVRAGTELRTAARTIELVRIRMGVVESGRPCVAGEDELDLRELQAGRELL
jgi:hypothetical protein